MADMTEADWLTETQVRDYWKRCTAQKRYNTPEPTVEQLEDYQNLLNARSHSKLADNIQRRLAEGLAKDDDSCPITVKGVQLCYLAASIKSSKKLSQSQIVGLEQKKLKDITFICRLSQGNTNKERVKQLPKVHTDSQNLQVAKLFQSITNSKEVKGQPQIA